MANFLRCPYCRTDVEPTSGRRCTSCGLPLPAGELEPPMGDALDALRGAWAQVSSHNPIGLRHEGATLRALLDGHNRELVRRLAAAGQAVPPDEYCEPEQVWALALDLLAGGARLADGRWTSALLLEGPAGSGKTGLLAQLATCLGPPRAPGPERDARRTWPRCLPCLITSLPAAVGPERSSALRLFFAELFAKPVSFFTDTTALAEWLQRVLLVNESEDTTLALLLDVSPPPATAALVWDEIRELIAIASQRARLKVIVAAERIPPSLAQAVLPCLHHRTPHQLHVLPPDKPAVLPLPPLNPAQILGTIPWFRERRRPVGRRVLDSALGSLTAPPGEEDRDADGELPSWNWRALARPWALRWYLRVAAGLKKPGFPFRTPASLASWGLDRLERLHAGVGADLDRLATALGAELAAPGFTAPPELLDALERLRAVGLTLRHEDGRWRLVLRPLGQYLLSGQAVRAAGPPPAHATPGLLKWCLLRATEDEHVQPRVIALLNGLRCAQPAYTIEELLELCRDIWEDGGHVVPAQAVARLLDGSGGGAACARFMLQLGLRLAAGPAKHSAMVWLNEAVRVLGRVHPSEGQSTDAAALLQAISWMALLLLHGGSTASAAMWIREGFEKLAYWERHQATDEALAEAQVLLLMTTILYDRNQNQRPRAQQHAEMLARVLASQQVPPTLRAAALTLLARLEELIGTPGRALELWEQVSGRAAVTAGASRAWFELHARIGVHRCRRQLGQPAPSGAEQEQLDELTRQVHEQYTPVGSALADLAIQRALLQLERRDEQEGNLSRLDTRLKVAHQLSAIPEHAPANIAISDNGVGLILKREGFLLEAEAVFLHAIDVYQRYVREWPPTPVHMKNISVYFYNLGFLYNRRGELQRAGTAYFEALLWRRRLVALEPQPEYQHDYALGLNVLGVLAYNNDDYEAARAWYEQALALLDRLVREQGEQQRCAKDLIVVLQNLALLEQETSDLERALERSIEAVDAVRTHVANPGEQADQLHRLAVAINSLGLRLNAAGKSKQGLLACQMALELAEQLVLRWPTRSQYIFGLSGVVSGMATVLHGQGKHRRAEEFEERVIGLLSGLIKAEPADRDLRCGLATVYLNMARSVRDKRRRAKVQRLLSDAQDILLHLLREQPDDERVIRLLADAQGQLRRIGALDEN